MIKDLGVRERFALQAFRLNLLALLLVLVVEIGYTGLFLFRRSCHRLVAVRSTCEPLEGLGVFDFQEFGVCVERGEHTW